MRLLLKLVPKKSHAYMNDYHYHLQAAIYSLIREGGLPDVHEKAGYKFFCFSNIFPYGDFEQGLERNLFVSSPDPRIIGAIRRAPLWTGRSEGGIFMGRPQFEIVGVSEPFDLDLRGPEVMVSTSTPIVMRIPKSRFEEYGIKPKIDYDYVFWRDGVLLEAFLTQLRDNMVKKWRDYHVERGLTWEPIEEGQLLPPIMHYKFIRVVSKPLILKGAKQIVIGSLWDLGFVVSDSPQANILNFSVDCGFGERNSLGFGFLNLKNK